MHFNEICIKGHVERNILKKSKAVLSESDVASEETNRQSHVPVVEAPNTGKIIPVFEDYSELLAVAPVRTTTCPAFAKGAKSSSSPGAGCDAQSVDMFDGEEEPSRDMFADQTVEEFSESILKVPQSTARPLEGSTVDNDGHGGGRRTQSKSPDRRKDRGKGENSFWKQTASLKEGFISYRRWAQFEYTLQVSSKKEGRWKGQPP